MAVRQQTKQKLLITTVVSVILVLLILFAFSGSNWILLKSLFTHDLSNEELKDQLPFRPSVQFLEPIYHWLKDYNNALQAYMDSEESWEEEYYRNLYNDPTWKSVLQKT